MTIEFPKLPNKRHNNSSAHPTEAGLTLVPVPSTTPDEPMHHAEQSVQSAPAITDVQLAELQASLKTPQATHRKKSKLLPILAGVLVLGALGAVAYPMYQTMSEQMAEEKAAAATPAVAPKPNSATKPASAPATTGTTSAPSPATAPVMAVTPAPVPSSTPTSPNAPEAVLDAGKTDDLQKPLLVDTTSSNPPKSDSAKDTAPTAPATLPKANATPEVTETKPDSKSTSKSDTTSSQNTSPKPASNKNTMSYDEFVKASDSAVYIEPPSKQK